MEVKLQPFTKKQRKELHGYVARGTVLFRAILFLAVMGVAGWLLRVLHAQLTDGASPFAHDAWWMVPLTALAIALYIRAGRWTGGLALRKKIRADLAGGQAAARRIVAVDAIEVEEQEDEGPAFFVLTDEGRTMLFAGQYLDRLKGKGFPWKAFDILEAPASRLFFGIDRAGDRLPPSARRPPFTWEEAKTLGALKGEYHVIEVDFESLKRDLAGSK
jgi:hypothetical protein